MHLLRMVERCGWILFVNHSFLPYEKLNNERTILLLLFLTVITIYRGFLFYNSFATAAIIIIV